MLIFLILFIMAIVAIIILAINLGKVKKNAEASISKKKIDELNEWAEDVKIQYKQQYKQQEDEMYRRLGEYKIIAENNIKKEVQDNINNVYSAQLKELQLQTKELELGIGKLKAEWHSQNADNERLIKSKEDIRHQIELYQNQIDIINEERRLKEAEKNELDTYKLLLNKEDLEDINYLDSISHHLVHPKILYKLIWSEYLLPAFNAMIKRQFGSNVPKNIIYCIEDLENEKKYIGKTAQTASVRWTNHIKTSLGISDTSPSAVHKAMKNNWTNFTFRVLEVVDDNDNINEREKYYIDFFKANVYGYNIKG